MQVSEYELQRQATIRRNQEFLRQMGLTSPVRLAPPTPPTAAVEPVRKRRATAPKRVTRLGASTLPPAVLSSERAAVVRRLPTVQIYQCRKCWRVLCDNRVCVTIPDAHVDHPSVLRLQDEFLLVASAADVDLDTFLVSSTEQTAADVGCMFFEAACACGADLGRFYVATTPPLDSVRHMYALRFSALRSYAFGSFSDVGTSAHAHHQATIADAQHGADALLRRSRALFVRLCELDDDLTALATLLLDAPDQQEPPARQGKRRPAPEPTDKPNDDDDDDAFQADSFSADENVFD